MPTNGRLGVAASPRGPSNATPELWAACVALSAEHGLVLHTHVNENRGAGGVACADPDGRDVYALERYGALGPSLVMAHGVWLDAGERDLVRQRGAHICHCPSSNLKLASGVAPIPDYLDRGINVALGADGAPCSNTLSALGEMRLAALLHKPRFGPRPCRPGPRLGDGDHGRSSGHGLADQIGSVDRASGPTHRDQPGGRPFPAGDRRPPGGGCRLHVPRRRRHRRRRRRPPRGRGRRVADCVDASIAAVAERERVAVLKRSGLLPHQAVGSDR